jgi:hypothetical protein
MDGMRNVSVKNGENLCLLAVRKLMERLLKRQVKLFRFCFLECFINATLQKLSEMIPPKLSDIQDIPSSSRSKVRSFVGPPLSSRLTVPSQNPMSQNMTALADQATYDKQNTRTATQASSNKAGYLGELFQIQIANSLLLVFRH